MSTTGGSVKAEHGGRSKSAAADVDDVVPSHMALDAVSHDCASTVAKHVLL
jgi:hypothetical protein